MQKYVLFDGDCQNKKVANHSMKTCAVVVAAYVHLLILFNIGGHWAVEIVIYESYKVYFCRTSGILI